jgi:hypothetical protein
MLGQITSTLVFSSTLHSVNDGETTTSFAWKHATTSNQTFNYNGHCNRHRHHIAVYQHTAPEHAPPAKRLPCSRCAAVPGVVDGLLLGSTSFNTCQLGGGLSLAFAVKQTRSPTLASRKGLVADSALRALIISASDPSLHRWICARTTGDLSSHWDSVWENDQLCQAHGAFVADRAGFHMHRMGVLPLHNCYLGPILLPSFYSALRLHH